MIVKDILETRLTHLKELQDAAKYWLEVKENEIIEAQKNYSTAYEIVANTEKEINEVLQKINEMELESEFRGICKRR